MKDRGFPDKRKYSGINDHTKLIMLFYFFEILPDLSLHQQDINQSQWVDVALAGLQLNELKKNIFDKLNMLSDLRINLCIGLNAVYLELVHRHVDDVDQTREIFLAKLWLISVTELP